MDSLSVLSPICFLYLFKKRWLQKVYAPVFYNLLNLTFLNVALYGLKIWHVDGFLIGH